MADSSNKLKVACVLGIVGIEADEVCRMVPRMVEAVRTGRRQEELVDRQRAFERATFEHLPSLIRTATRLFGRGPEAEDLVQDAMLRAWSAFGRYEDRGNAKAWLFRILLNQAAKRGKRLRDARTMPFEDAETLGLCTEPDVSPSDRLAIRRAFEDLSIDHRAVLTLVVLEGLTCQEASEALNVPIGTVMSRLSRARDAMKKALLGHEPPASWRPQ